MIKKIILEISSFLGVLLGIGYSFILMNEDNFLGVLLLPTIFSIWVFLMFTYCFQQGKEKK